jgi:hypothetical protein
VLLAIVGSSAACATAGAAGGTASTDPCVGLAFDADAPLPNCLVPYSAIETPRGRLEVRSDPELAVMQSGHEATFILTIRNVDKVPVAVDLDDSCTAFDAIAESPHASSFETECGGLCGHRETKLRVTLLPGGVVRKKVTLDGMMRRITGDACKEQVLGPLPAGSYVLVVNLPWTVPTPIPGNATAVSNAVFRGPLEVRK